MIIDNEGTNDGMTKAKEAEQTCVIDDSGTKEEENTKEDKAVEDQLDWLKKQYNTICEMWAEYRTEYNRMTKEEENVKEDGVVEDQFDWMKKQYDKICEMYWMKKQYDSICEMETEYRIEYKKYQDSKKVLTMNTMVKRKHYDIKNNKRIFC